MAGYTRQSVADIIANAVIKAAPVNAEYNAIRDAFNASTGHKHDGTSAEGAYVPVISDVDNYNKVVVDAINNRISFYNEVSSSAVEQIRLEDGVLKPVTDDDVDLGAAGAEFKDLYIDGIGYIDSVVITGGTIDNTVIGGTTPAAADFTTMDTTGNASVGGTFAVTGTSTFTGAMSAGSLTTTGQATLATVDINGGTIDNATIGNTTPASVTGTLITANTGFSGPLTGAVTGNVTGNVTGDLTGGVTGNVTASSGSSTFNDVTINGTLNMNAGTTATITNLTTPNNAGDAATKGYVDTSVANIIDSAPGTLDTLNELAAALGDDPAFATTVTDSIATKLPLAGGTMTGAIAMGTSKITGLGDPTAAQDAATKTYVDTNFLGLTGGTMTGAIDMGSAKITTTYTPTDTADLTTKTYVDGILGSATAAATSAANAATSATAASNSATAAATSEANAAASYDSFDDRYLGAKATAPTVDNDGDALTAGVLYYNSTDGNLYHYNGTTWVTNTSFGANLNNYTATAGQTTLSVNYEVGFISVWLNGVKLVPSVDFTATSGTGITFTSALTAGDTIDVTAYNLFEVANALTRTNNLSDVPDVATARSNLGLVIGTDVQAYNANLASINQNLSTTSSPSFTEVSVNSFKPAAYYAGASSTVFINSDYQIYTLNLQANITIDFSNLTNGEHGIIMISDGSGYTVTWSNGLPVQWANNDGSAPTLVTSGYNCFSYWKAGNGYVYVAYHGDQ